MLELTPIMRKFVLHWGEMGARWGVNRTVAQIHALLYVSPQPLHAEDIAQALDVARSNVSNSLRELQGWGVVKIVHVLGDRRDHFQSLADVWEMFEVVLEERRRREIDPTIAILRECVAAAKAGGKPEEHTHRKLSEMLNFFETMTGWYEQLRGFSKSTVARLVKLGAKLPKMLGLG